MITLMRGNLLEDCAEAHVNTVNTVGVMGKGIADQFKRAFPNMFKQYVKDCKAGKVKIGKMHIVETSGITTPKYIINFPTKQHWRNPSKLEYITEGLVDLVRVVEEYKMKSIAIPPLGCGNGGLDWQVVRPLILEAFSPLDTDVYLYEPVGASSFDKPTISTEKPRLTDDGAVLLAAMDRYAKTDYRMSQLEVQKIAYFLHKVGALQGLTFDKGLYGPYAENLNPVLQMLEEHYIRGYGDKSNQAEIYLLEDTMDVVEEYLHGKKEAQTQVRKVATLMEGFITPYDLELLSSVDWVLEEEPLFASDPERVVASMQDWSPRKKHVFSIEDIKKVWYYLYDEPQMV